MGTVYYTNKNKFWQCLIGLEGGNDKDREACSAYKKEKGKCKFYRESIAHHCEYPEYKEWEKSKCTEKS